MTSGALRIVVSGLTVTYPFGGVFWDYFQYVLGLRRLGHEVLYVEDTGRWVYDPVTATFREDAEHNVAVLTEAVRTVAPSLGDRWFVRDSTGRTYGRSWHEVVAFCRSADLFLNISGSSMMREEYFAARAAVYVDSDPMYTQATVAKWTSGDRDPQVAWRMGVLRRHHRFFTFAENIGAPDCRVPSDAIQWLPTRQPIVLDCWMSARVPLASRRRMLTTIASWEPSERGPLIDGVAYHGKSREFERFIELPARSREPLELALSGPAPVERLRQYQWRIADGYVVSRDPLTYRRYLASSLGEWSVAKHAYVASRSGWFSCRTACYLALGVPVVVQDTGFNQAIPTGRGLLTFQTLGEAVVAIEQLASTPGLHSAAALEVAREYFDSDRVLSRLLEQALGARAPRPVGP
jgi:hypothetical protein